MLLRTSSHNSFPAIWALGNCFRHPWPDTVGGTNDNDMSFYCMPNKTMQYHNMDVLWKYSQA